jgi:hypothetical protein
MGRHADVIREQDGIYRRITDIQTRLDQELETALAGVD